MPRGCPLPGSCIPSMCSLGQVVRSKKQVLPVSEMGCRLRNTSWDMDRKKDFNLPPIWLVAITLMWIFPMPWWWLLHRYEGLPVLIPVIFLRDIFTLMRSVSFLKTPGESIRLRLYLPTFLPGFLLKWRQVVRRRESSGYILHPYEGVPQHTHPFIGMSPNIQSHVFHLYL